MKQRIKAAALRVLEAVQANKERVVIVLTGLVFAPAAAAVAAWVGAHFPGVDISSNTLVGLGATGFLGAVGLAVTWLRGAQKEADNASAERVAVLQSTGSTGAVHDAKVAAAAKVMADATASTPEGPQTP